MKIRSLLAIVLLSVLILAWCSSKYANNKNSKVSNILSWSFKTKPSDTISSGSKNLSWSKTLNGSIKNITDSQPQKTNVIISEKVTPIIIIKKLIEIWAWMINECQYKSELYFSVDFNNLKLPTKIVDKRWNIFATCDYNIESKYHITSICENLQKCKLIYVAKKNVRWYTPVDKYSIVSNTRS